MENTEMEWLRHYAERLNDSEGKLTVLSKDERHHLALLLRKYELEQKLGELEAELSQEQLL